MECCLRTSHTHLSLLCVFCGGSELMHLHHIVLFYWAVVTAPDPLSHSQVSSGSLNTPPLGFDLICSPCSSFSSRGLGSSNMLPLFLIIFKSSCINITYKKCLKSYFPSNVVHMSVFLFQFFFQFCSMFSFNGIDLKFALRPFFSQSTWLEH